ncbi:MAG TPA: phosphatidylserine/phosphatidylglycerophosphate/cardiolipin synthase family protein [Leptolyngbyaceae cyanobacterium M33_DOE_097]|uniref:Phosphatidylserine/phosphatidylglycerophosphate/ cardiolipin synthase family protein n=1 Tax=Oscillatoriales cyanobacterium SpSt-418 TaxID=2282169 RepID=A0A7C3KCI0_9CYAN|nr:phosphatidylserine/phosphatidylglycerophosphate/cardiolipin synthase family protein [Leptolyngbyaceae cyanobacterium M33_DOE_097]
MNLTILGIVFSVFLLILFPLSWLYVRSFFYKNSLFKLIGTPSTVPNFALIIASLTDSQRTCGSILQFWSTVDTIQTTRLDAIAQARESILFETFIMTPGDRADAFSRVLCEKAETGVKVQLLADAYGAKTLPKTYWNRLINAGVEVRFFNPFSWRAPVEFLRRNHRKLLIIDQQMVLIGGAGIADRWDGVEQEGPSIPWLDFEVQVEGEVVSLLTGLFWQHWLDAAGTVDLNDYKRTPAIAKGNTPILITPGEDPTRSDSPIRSLFQILASSAQSRLWIASPYLLPDAMTLRILAEMQQKGVDIRILTMGRRCDKPYVYAVSRERYKPLLQSKIQLYEYQPSMMHAKIILIDDHWVSLGSANLDPRSFFHNDELNLCSNDPPLIESVERFFKQGFADSQLVDWQKWQQRSLKQKIKGKIGSLFFWQL